MPFALITGASGGIGWALAKELASRKHDVLLVARNPDALQKNARELKDQFGVSADYLSLDLSRPDAPGQVKQWLTQKGYSIDILINNAGFGLWGNLADLPMDGVSQMMQLNMITLADLCKLLLPELSKNQKAYILNVSSTAAYQAVPTLTTYAATKAFVLLFSRGLRWELQEGPVSVSCLCPGTTTTGFIDRARIEERVKQRAEKVTMKPEDVARIGINGMLAGKSEIIPGPLNWISAKLAELMPKVLPEMIARNLYR